MSSAHPPATSGDAQIWVVLIVKVPANPSRHRVAVWRELRRSGAVPLGQGVWTLPDLPQCREGLARVLELVGQGEGEVLVLNTHGQTERDAQQLSTAFTRARNEEWTEFLAECGHYVNEIAKEIAKDKLTMAELEEEEQSLERLRRWHLEIARRDVFDVSSGAEAASRLQECADRFDDYAQLVYARVELG